MRFFSSDLNIWSDSHWSELSKQFNKSSEFPLPGQTGIARHSTQQPQQCAPKLAGQLKDLNLDENLDFLIHKPFSHEFQALKLKEAAGGLFYKSKIDNSLFNLPNSRKMFELNLVKCPVSLAKGKLTIKILLFLKII